MVVLGWWDGTPVIVGERQQGDSETAPQWWWGQTKAHCTAGLSTNTNLTEAQHATQWPVSEGGGSECAPNHKKTTLL